MPKDLEHPDLLTGRDKVELAAEPSAGELHKFIADAVKEGLGVVHKEMREEAKAVARETAEKVLEGKGEEASSGDPENIYTNKELVNHFRRMLGDSQAPVTKQESAMSRLAKSAVFLWRAGGRPDAAMDLAEKSGLRGEDLAFVGKTLGVDDFTAGGALVQGEMWNEVVPELLSETALFDEGGIQRVPVAGQLTVPYESSGPTTRFVAENAARNASTIAYEQLSLTPKEMGVIVPASKKMLRTVPGTASFVEQSMRRSLAVDVDAKLIRGVGGANEPPGLRYLAQSANLLNVNGTVSAANTVIDLTRLQQAVQAGNVAWTADRSRCAFSPRTWRYLFALRDTNNYIFRDEMITQGTVNGIPVAGQSGRGISAIPENLSVMDSSESEIYFYSVDWLLAAIGEDVRIEMSDTAAYNNSSGTVVAAFSRDQVVWKLNFSMDFNSRVRGYDIACLIDVGWGV